MTLLSARLRGLFALLGVLTYLGLAAPEFVTAYRFCGGVELSPIPYACAGRGLPAPSHFLYWLVPAPFLFLYLSARLRRAVSIGRIFAAPRTAAWSAGPFMAVVALFVIWGHWPVWTLPRALDDAATVVAWAALAAFMLLLSAVRNEQDFADAEQSRAFPRLAMPVIVSGVLLYAGVAVAEFFRMVAGTAQCPPGSVCDMPAMVFMAFCGVIWLPGWAIFLPFVIAAADRKGIKPWASPEVRIGAVVMALLVLAFGLTAFRGGALGVPTGLFYILFAAWFLVVQHLCGRAAAEREAASLPDIDKA